MVMRDIDIKELASQLLRSIIFNPLPVDSQETAGTGESFWCADWWTLEVAKYFYLGGEAGYLDDPPARRLQNLHFSGVSKGRQKTVKFGKHKENMMKVLEEYKEEANGVLICEIGRGLDMMCALVVKEWEVYYCYDADGRHRGFLKELFGKYDCVIKFFHNNSKKVDFDDALQDHEGKVIALSNTTQLGQVGCQRLLDCPKVVRIINNGQLIDSPDQWS
jgi:hypothetical protein